MTLRFFLRLCSFVEWKALKVASCTGGDLAIPGSRSVLMVTFRVITAGMARIN